MPILNDKIQFEHLHNFPQDRAIQKWYHQLICPLVLHISDRSNWGVKMTHIAELVSYRDIIPGRIVGGWTARVPLFRTCKIVVFPELSNPSSNIFTRLVYNPIHSRVAKIQLTNKLIIWLSIVLKYALENLVLSLLVDLKSFVCHRFKCYYFLMLEKILNLIINKHLSTFA